MCVIMMKITIKKLFYLLKKHRNILNDTVLIKIQKSSSSHAYKIIAKKKKTKSTIFPALHIV